ncbi:MAG: esterase/lipase family protein [Planctomycetota bacterium]
MKPRRRLCANQASDDPSVVILVHGTFAGASQDRGNKWWQAGSTTARQLQARLPGHVEVASDAMVFHWSGENSERARSRAASDLLKFVEPLETQGIPYHLVGHSHGGSVIWNMLKLATIQHRSLERLRTWTTVGTPFLQHCGRNPWNPINLLLLLVGFLLLRPAYRTLKHLSILLWNAALGKREAFLLSNSESANLQNFFDYPILSFLRWTGIRVVEVPQGVEVGAYDPDGPLSVAGYLFTTREGLFMFCMAICAAYLFLIIGLMCIRPVIESFRIRAEYQLEDDAFATYQSRWLGIWSPDDEAINGLRATLDIAVSFLGKLQPRERVFLSDNLNLLASPIFWVFAPLYNFLVHPIADRSIRSIVARSAQGNDRPTANVIDVSPCPFGALKKLAPPIPDSLNNELLASADEAAGDVAPKLRRLLGGPSFTSGLESFSKDLAGSELIHTAYFEHPKVLDLVACNIAWGTNEHAMRVLLERMPRDLANWFAGAKSHLITDIATLSGSPWLPSLGRTPPKQAA